MFYDCTFIILCFYFSLGDKKFRWTGGVGVVDFITGNVKVPGASKPNKLQTSHTEVYFKDIISKGQS